MEHCLISWLNLLGHHIISPFVFPDPFHRAESKWEQLQVLCPHRAKVLIPWPQPCTLQPRLHELLTWGLFSPRCHWVVCDEEEVKRSTQILSEVSVRARERWRLMLTFSLAWMLQPIVWISSLWAFSLIMIMISVTAEDTLHFLTIIYFHYQDWSLQQFFFFLCYCALEMIPIEQPRNFCCLHTPVKLRLPYRPVRAIGKVCP